MKHSTKECHRLARDNGGVFLSDRYAGVHEKHLWRCKESHAPFLASFNSVLRGSWCKRCRQHKAALRRAIPISEWRRRAAVRGDFTVLKLKRAWGKHTILLVRCKNDASHTFEIEANSVRSGRGCKYCSKNVRLTIHHAFSLARERGGKCLSDSYSTARTPLLWQCGFRHRLWKATYDHVRQGTWCPECSRGLGERICRAYFEQLFGVLFPPSYPVWLRSDRGTQLELDGMNVSLKLAFEHHGEYHYSTRGYFSRSEQELATRQKVDQLKRTLCRKNGVRLVEIPEVPKFQSISGLKETIEKECRKAGVKIPKTYNSTTVVLKEAFKPDFLRELREICTQRKGRLISKSYLGARIRHHFECECRHRWWAVPDSVRRGSWCQRCGYLRAAITRANNRRSTNK